jgi:hypothetical protein
MPGGGAAVLSLSPAGLHHFGLEQMRLPARAVNQDAAMDAIYHGNAECLLPRLRSKAHERI